MVAVSRFVEFSVTSQTYVTGVSTDATAKGTRGYFRGTGLTTGNDDFTITLNSNDQLAVAINGVGPFTITLASGTALDPRFVARDITYKINSASSDASFAFAQCEFRNGGLVGTNSFNSFIVKSGKLGKNASGNTVAITSPGGRDARATLGMASSSAAAGQDQSDLIASSYTGAVTVSGAYGGQFDDFYTVMISSIETVGTVTPGGGNTYNGTATVGGLYTGVAGDSYTVTISTTAGSTMGAGSGNVPTFTVTDTPGSDDNANPIELLYPGAWYDIGSLGVRAKFTDAVFGNGDTFAIQALTASGGTGAVTTAKYIWSSTLEDSSKAYGISAVTTSTVGTQVGTKGVTIAFSNSGTLSAGERFHIICRGPRATSSSVTQLNFGNVTVSTNSAVKVVWFELISGAVSMSTVKFSLQNHGTFSHHNAGNNDTYFHYGTVGGGHNAAGAGPTTNSQVAFPVDATGLGKVVATDIDQDIPPTYLYATQNNLAVVSSADSSQTVGNYMGALVSDFIFLAIQLGANETGANSTMNYRMYFDFQ